MIYCDTSYIVRLYLGDHGAEHVRSLCEKNPVACSLHGKIEVIAALHRAFRERRVSKGQFESLVGQFEIDCEQSGYTWYSTTPETAEKLLEDYRKLPSTVFLRGADALHLACARENRHKEIYSNDRHLLAAASRFGLKACNVIL